MIGAAPDERKFMLSQQDIVSALAQVPGPDGKTPLPQSGALGGIVVREDRVFVSLEVDSSRAAAAEPLRARVEAVVKAIPGVAATFVTLTAQKPADSAPSRAPQPHQPHSHAHAAPPGPKAQAARTPQGGQGRQDHYRRRFRQRRGSENPRPQPTWHWP